MAGVVVIAVDASQTAETAFDWYMQHIHRHGNNLVILHCVDLSTMSAHDAEVTSEASFTLMWHQEKKKIKALEEKYQWKMNEASVPGKIRTEEGKAGDVIIRVCKEEKAGLIVIGSRGLSKLKRTLQRSVSDYVLHNCSCPVVICRQYEPEPDPSASDSAGQATASGDVAEKPEKPVKEKGSPFRRFSLKRKNSNKTLTKSLSQASTKE